jgi:hypothetical protein
MGITKICRSCGIEKEKNSGFYVHATMADGYLNKCKECVKSRAKTYRFQNDSVREYDRKRYYENSERKEYSKKQSKKWHQDNKKKAKEIRLAWISRNPEKRKAHIIVSNAVRDGLLKKQSCSICGTEKTEAHHDDYSKPLEVIWFCKNHHGERHRKYENSKTPLSS